MPILRWHCTSHVSHQRTSAASAASEPAAYTLNMSGTTQVINNGLNKYKQVTTLSETKIKAVWSVPSNYLSIYAIQLLKLGPQPHTLALKNVHCSDNTVYFKCTTCWSHRSSLHTVGITSLHIVLLPALTLIIGTETTLWRAKSSYPWDFWLLSSDKMILMASKWLFT